MSDQAAFLRVMEADALLGVSPNPIRAWSGEGKIPGYRHTIHRFRLDQRVELERVIRDMECSRRGRSRGR